MSPKTDTEVIIGGKVFTLSGYESEDYMQKIASYINGKITEYGKLDGFRRQPLDKQNILLQMIILKPRSRSPFWRKNCRARKKSFMI